MKKLLSMLILLAVLFATTPTIVNANDKDYTRIIFGEEFTDESESAKINGIISFNDDYKDIKWHYEVLFNGTVSYDIYEGGVEAVETVEYSNLKLYFALYEQPKTGSNDGVIYFDMSEKIGKNKYDVSLRFHSSIELYIKNNEPITATLPSSKTYTKSSNSTQPDRLYWFVDELYRETTELDDKDGEPIKVYYLTDLDDYLRNDVVLTDENGEQLQAGYIKMTKNVTNLKYGTRNGTITFNANEQGYGTTTIPITITYLPLPELEYSTRHTFKLVPINGALFSIDGKTWQTSNKFKGLVANTEYTVYVKAKNDTNGTTIQTITVKTED